MVQTLVPPPAPGPASLADAPLADALADRHLRLDPAGRLQLLAGDEIVCPDATAKRALPWTNPDAHVDVRDRKGTELWHIDDLEALPDEERLAVATWLDRNTFVPKVREITRLTTGGATMRWDVVSDRGPTSFRVREREDVAFLADGRMTVRDTSGVTYELPPMDDLDPASRKLLSRIV